MNTILLFCLEQLGAETSFCIIMDTKIIKKCGSNGNCSYQKLDLLLI